MKIDLSKMATFGVAGNFTGHLEQAGEAVDFTNVKNYTAYTALKSPVLPLFNTTLTAIDEDGMGYTGIFNEDGRIAIAVRSYIPESKKQILRFSCIAFASI